ESILKQLKLEESMPSMPLDYPEKWPLYPQVNLLPMYLLIYLMNNKKGRKHDVSHISPFSQACSRGFEPPTHGTGNHCSIQLSYEHMYQTTKKIGRAHV